MVFHNNVSHLVIYTICIRLFFRPYLFQTTFVSSYYASFYYHDSVVLRLIVGMGRNDLPNDHYLFFSMYRRTLHRPQCSYPKQLEARLSCLSAAYDPSG